MLYELDPISVVYLEHGLKRLEKLVDASLQGKHIHTCFGCGDEFVCKCSHPDERMICGPCDGEELEYDS